MTGQNLDNSTLHLEIPFPSAREAEIAYNSLRIDGEPKRSQVIKSLTLDGRDGRKEQASSGRSRIGQASSGRSRIGQASTGRTRPAQDGAG